MGEHIVSERDMPGSGSGHVNLIGCLYQLDADQAVYDDPAKRAAIGEFLGAHGIDPGRFIIGNPIYVRRRDDGELWVDTWQSVKVDGSLVGCESCPHCVKQERVKTRLVAGVPEFFDGPFGRVDRVA